MFSQKFLLASIRAIRRLHTPIRFHTSRVSPSTALNVSTRLAVGTSDIDWLIGGFIVTGNAPKKVIVRAIGASPQPVSSHLLTQIVHFN